MKNLIKRSLLIATIFTLPISYAMSNEPNPNTNIIIVNGKLIDLTLDYSDGDLEVNVQDSFGFVLYKEKYTGVALSRKFDLTLLPNGNYFFEINGQTKIKIIPFTVSSKNVNFEKEKETVFFKPIVRFKDDVVYISKLALKKETMNIKVYDINANLLYSEELKDNTNLGRKLNFSKLELGNYRVVLKSDGRVFEEIIKKI
ncbi:hypothetical protein [Lutibacter sp.]|uniref:hypothetical protein n=1 Tax=Lutibacter sp. TaxID=1925666 RepID=UPI0027366475|nr:hypothetical protein [Lutibacter sp.]MDP3313407.1 hypothetical protein [Lutibacter sp.]